MKIKSLLLLLVLAIAALAIAACAPAPTPTPVPTAVPTKAAPPTAVPPTAVPPTAAPKPTIAPTTASAAAATAVPSVAPTTAAAASPTKVAAAGPATLAPTNATPTLIAAVPKTADDIQVISPQLLKALVEGGADIAIADAQPPEAYVLGHIKGAVNVPWDMKIKSAGGLPMNKLVFVYCACSPDEKASQTDEGDVAMQLITTFGYRKIALLDGGWVRWQQLGYPSEKGK